MDKDNEYHAKLSDWLLDINDDIEQAGFKVDGESGYFVTLESAGGGRANLMFLGEHICHCDDDEWPASKEELRALVITKSKAFAKRMAEFENPAEDKF